MSGLRHGLQAMVAGLALLLFSWPSPVPAQAGSAFDHFTTGFELVGKHRDVPCEGCHVNAVFKGTPRDCVGCHQRGSRHLAVGGRGRGSHRPPTAIGGVSGLTGPCIARW